MVNARRARFPLRVHGKDPRDDNVSLFDIPPALAGKILAAVVASEPDGRSVRDVVIVPLDRTGEGIREGMQAVRGASARAGPKRRPPARSTTASGPLTPG